MKKALILGTNAGQADIIRYLKEKNWEVHVCGYKKEGPGSVLSNQFHLVDTIDVEAVKELAKKLKVDIVYSVSSDSAIRTATKVSEQLNLPTLLNSEIIDLFYYKDRLRAFLNSNKINAVKYIKFSDWQTIQHWDVFPCVVKPSDSQGQRGVVLVNSNAELQRAAYNAIDNSLSKTAVVEEYLDGVEVSTNMIVQNGKVVVNELTERIIHGHEYFGLPKGHSIPARNITVSDANEARNLCVKLVEGLEISDAVLYIQMVVTKNGVKIIEVAPRLDGCHIWRLIKFAKGYDLREYNIDCLIGNDIMHRGNDLEEEYTLTFHQLKAEEVFDENKLSLPQETVYNEYRYENGDRIKPINGKLEVVGYLIEKI
jgi:biotin carboxylase